MLSSECFGPKKTNLSVSPASVAHSLAHAEPKFDVGEYIIFRGKVFSCLGAARIVSYTPTLSNPYEVKPCAVKVCNKIVSSKVQLDERTFMCSEADMTKAIDYKKSMKAAAAIKIQAIARGHACKDYIAKMKRVAARRPISHAEHLSQLIASHNQARPHRRCHYCGHNASSLAALQQHMHDHHRDPEWGTPSAQNNGSAFQVYYNPPQQAQAQVPAPPAPTPAVEAPPAPAAPAVRRKRKRFGGIELGISPMWFQKRRRGASRVSTFSTLHGQNNLVFKTSDSVAREKARVEGRPHKDVYYEEE